MNVSDTCNAAADLIEVRGWMSGKLGKRDSGPLCLEGALAVVSGLEVRAAVARSCAAYWAIRDYLNNRPLWGWNDVQRFKDLSDNPHPLNSPEAHEWGKQNVIATLRAVAVIHAAREDESVETRTVEAVAR